MADNIAQTIHSSKNTIFLLENLRFYLEEEGKGVNKEGQKVKADA
jgi:phosphoglycerate kinase